MADHKNTLGQPVGQPVDGWRARPRPPRTPLPGTYCRIEPLQADRHSEQLFAANQQDHENRMWTYMGYGPFADLGAYRAWVASVEQLDDPLYFAIIDQPTGEAVGVASYLRLDPANGVIEVGNIAYSPRLQRTDAGTEAMYLMMKRAFTELGYRRYEWKCDSLNGPSRAAAARYGFQFEGIFRQAVIYKNRNRDTAWFAITDAEWPVIDRAFTNWLAAANRDPQGKQIKSLMALMPGAKLPS